MPRNALIQVRRDTASNWTSIDPVLESGEFGYETDAGRLKAGNGVDPWTSLPYFYGSITFSSTIPDTPNPADIWINISSEKLFLYHDSAWIEMLPGAFPSTPILNQVYVDSGSKRIWTWDGEKWIASSAQIVEGDISNNAVTDIKLRDSAAYSVIGRSASTSGDPADIVAGTAQHVLKRGLTSLEFGQVDTDGIADGAVTSEKLALGSAVPSGIISPYAGITQPSGWVFCNGGTYLRTGIYASLFATFSTTFASAVTNGTTTISGLSGMSAATHVGWGVAGQNIPDNTKIASVTNATTVVLDKTATGSGTVSLVISPYGFTGANNTTTFNVPNMNGNVPVGVSSGDVNFGIMGKTGGTSVVTLTAAQSGLPVHQHANTISVGGTFASSGHTHSGSSLKVPIGATQDDAGSIGYVASTVGSSYTSTSQYTVKGSSFFSTTRNFNHHTPVYGSTGSASDTASVSGSITNVNSITADASQSHQNLQPYITVRYIIKL